MNKMPGINVNNQLVEYEKRFFGESTNKVRFIWKSLYDT